MESYKFWASLYDNEVHPTIWMQETDTNLRAILMLHHSLQKHLSRFKESLNCQIHDAKKLEITKVPLKVNDKENTQGTQQSILNSTGSPLLECKFRSQKLQHSFVKQQIFKSDTDTDEDFLKSNNTLAKKKEFSFLDSPPIKKTIKKRRKKYINCTTGDMTLTQLFKNPITRKKTDISKKILNENCDVTASLDMDDAKIEDDSSENDDLKTSMSGHRFEISSNFLDELENMPEIDIKRNQNKTSLAVVRGKAARQKLPAWSCKECEFVYKALNLPDEELQRKIQQCSKHRSHKPPPPQTFDGFWDLTVGPTPATNTSQLSMVFDLTP